MKKLSKLINTLFCLLSLVACAQKQEPSPQIKPDDKPELTNEVKNIGDAFRQAKTWEMNEQTITIVSEDFVYEASLPEGMYARLNEIDFFAEDRDEQYAKILEEVALDKITPRENYKLTPDQINSLIGQKGQALLNLGFSNDGWNLSNENAYFFMSNMGYTYTLIVEEHFEDSDDFFADEAIASSTIKEIKEGY